jgi:hypothetical protein
MSQNIYNTCRPLVDDLTFPTIQLRSRVRSEQQTRDCRPLGGDGDSADCPSPPGYSVSPVHPGVDL